MTGDLSNHAQPIWNFCQNLFVIAHFSVALSLDSFITFQVSYAALLIGATTRERVRKEAEAFRQMSKGDAAYEIAKIIGKDSGHVKRYLTELFPGGKWKTNSDF